MKKVNKNEYGNLGWNDVKWNWVVLIIVLFLILAGHLPLFYNSFIHIKISTIKFSK